MICLLVTHCVSGRNNNNKTRNTADANMLNDFPPTNDNKKQMRSGWKYEKRTDFKCTIKHEANVN